MSDLIYLASPYTGTNEEMIERFNLVCEFTAKLMRGGRYVFSPIAHCHPPAQHGLPKDWEYWQGYCELMVPKCNKFMVLMLDGWQASRGVNAELELAVSLNIPVEFVLMTDNVLTC